MTRARAYDVSFQLTTGTYAGCRPTFTVWAFNKSDADLEGFRRLVEAHGWDTARAALRYGVERHTA